MTSTPDETFVEANGLHHHVLTWAPVGAPAGPATRTAVLLHGFLDMAWSWHWTALALRALDPGLRIVAFDWRGHGESDRAGPGSFYHFADYVRDLDALMGRLAQGRTLLVGHSMGGGVASLWLGARPGRVERAVLVEGGGPRPGGPDEFVGRLAEWLDQTVPFDPARFERPMDDLDHAARRLGRLDPRLTPAQVAFLASKAAVVGADGKVRWRYDPLNRVRSPTPLFPGLFEAFWRQIDVPVTWVDAEESPLRLEDDDPRLAAFRCLRRTVLPAAGHMVQHHQPESLARLLLSDFTAP